MSDKKSFSFLFAFVLFSEITFAATTNSSEILYEIDFIVRVYKNGTVERILGTKTVPPSFDPTAGVQSKDVVIDPTQNISARLYLPIKASPIRKLPLLISFHGGGFFVGSAFGPDYHKYLNSIVGEANVVAVSVDYRLAPEHPLPIAYQDSWVALKWVLSHRHSKGNTGRREAWLTDYVDFERVYLAGESAGGNIAHNLAIRAGSEGIKLHGLFLNCPHFWGTNPIGNEPSQPKREAWVESIWIHAYPNSTGFDDPRSNPAKDPDLSKLGSKKVLVYVAELDVLKDRGWYYAETLKKRGWNGSVKVVEVKGEDHVFNLVHPNSTNAKKLLQQFGLFLNNKLGYAI